METYEYSNCLYEGRRQSVILRSIELISRTGRPIRDVFLSVGIKNYLNNNKKNEDITGEKKKHEQTNRE